MAFFSNEFLNRRRQELLNDLGKFQYQVNGSSWQDGTVNSADVVGNSVVVYAHAPASGKEDTITGVRIYDRAGRIAVQGTVSLKRNRRNSALLKIEMPLNEG